MVSLSYTYELPFGRNKHYVNHGRLSEVVGGWSVSGIHQYQSGRPIHIEYDAFGASNPYFAAGDGFSFRPNLVPGQPFKNPAYKRGCSGPITAVAGRVPCQFYINPAAFSIPPSGEFGNAPNLISALRMPAYWMRIFPFRSAPRYTSGSICNSRQTFSMRSTGLSSLREGSRRLSSSMRLRTI